MPLIPTGNNNRQGLSVSGTPRINNPEMGMGAVNASKQAQGEVVNTLENIEDTFVKVREFRQKNEADAYVLEKLSAIKATADQDINFAPSIYATEIDKVGAEASKTITGGLAKQEFMANFKKQAIATNWGIKNLFRERELEAAKASIEYKRQNLVNSYAGMTPAEQMAAVVDFKTTLMGGVKAGIYDQATAQAIDSKFQSDVQMSVVDNHIMANPAATLVGLKEGKDGPYPGISEQFRTDSIEKATAYDKKYKAEAEAARLKQIDATENDIVTRMIDPQKPKPTEGEIVTLMNNQTISPKFAKAAIDNIRSAKKTKEERKRTPAFNKMADFITNGENKPEDIRVELLRQNELGLLDDGEFNILYTFNSQIGNKNIDEVNPKKSFMDTLTFWSDENAGMKSIEAKARMYKDYMMRVNKGEEPALAVDAVLKKEVLLLHPKAASYPKEGKKVMDSNGVFKTIFPTGEIKDFQLKEDKAL